MMDETNDVPATKYACDRDEEMCGWRGFSAEVLRAPDPFNEGDTLQACPRCRCQSVYPCCDKTECWEGRYSGMMTPSGIRWTCLAHRA